METDFKGDTETLLKVQDLHITFNTPSRERFEAVRGVTFSIKRGEAVALVGESGSGKSCTALALTRLLPPEPNCQSKGRILFKDCSVLELSNSQLRSIRGGGIAYVFQEPSMALNPSWTVGFQIVEAIKYHQPKVTRRVECAYGYFKDVGIQDPERFFKSYPHELSGGMQQRAVIAQALACQPQLLVADEPTTALDVSLQQQIINLLRSLQQKHQMSLLLITHNFSLLSDFVHRALVMFRGQIVEEGTPEKLFVAPQHPYTRALVACIPRLNQRRTLLPTIDYNNLVL